jgi:hypothetical protein
MRNFRTAVRSLSLSPPTLRKFPTPICLIRSQTYQIIHRQHLDKPSHQFWSPRRARAAWSCCFTCCAHFQRNWPRNLSRIWEFGEFWWAQSDVKVRGNWGEIWLLIRFFRTRNQPPHFSVFLFNLHNTRTSFLTNIMAGGSDDDDEDNGASDEV